MLLQKEPTVQYWLCLLSQLGAPVQNISFSFACRNSKYSWLSDKAIHGYRNFLWSRLYSPMPSKGFGDNIFSYLLITGNTHYIQENIFKIHPVNLLKFRHFFTSLTIRRRRNGFLTTIINFVFPPCFNFCLLLINHLFNSHEPLL